MRAVLLVLFTVLLFFPAVPTVMPDKFKIGGAIIVVAWVVAVLRADRPPVLWRQHPWIVAAALGLTLWTVASALEATAPATALGAAGRMAIGVALMIIVFTFARDRAAARALMLAYIVGGVLTTLYGVVVKPGPPIQGIAFDPTRLYGGMGEPNDLAAVLVPAIALGLFSLPTVRNSLGRLALAACLVVLVVGLVLSRSRGGLVAAIAMLLAGVCLGGPLRARIGVICVALAAGVGYYIWFASDALQGQMNSLLRINAYGGLAEGTGRIELWKAAVALIRAHPIFGVGARNYRPVTGESLVVHNTYLEVQAELGAVGLLLFLSVVVGVIVVTLRGIRAAIGARDIDGELQARGVLVGLVGLLIAYVFLSGEYQPQFWWLLGLGLACGPPLLREPPGPEPASWDTLNPASRGKAR